MDVPSGQYDNTRPTLASLAEEVAPGIHRCRMPLPFRPPEVNVWLIEDRDGWTLIDCGPSTPQVTEIWSRLFAGPLANKPVRRIVATHGHLDHVGHAGPLFAACPEATFHCTRTEYLAASLRALDRDGGARPDARGYFTAHGFTEDEAVSLCALSPMLRYLEPMPPQFHRLVDGGTIAMGGRDWQVITAEGHALEHASFFCERDGILIAGDQILPRISPFIGVFPEEPEANPLHAYLASLEIFARLPGDTLVLPSHGSPFSDLHGRIAQIRQHHESRLDAIRLTLAEAGSAREVALRLFPEAMAGLVRRLAFAETMAHLNHLQALGRIRQDRTATGEIRYRAD